MDPLPAWWPRVMGGVRATRIDYSYFHEIVRSRCTLMYTPSGEIVSVRSGSATPRCLAAACASRSRSCGSRDHGRLPLDQDPADLAAATRAKDQHGRAGVALHVLHFLGLVAQSQVDGVVQVEVAQRHTMRGAVTAPLCSAPPIPTDGPGRHPPPLRSWTHSAVVAGVRASCSSFPPSYAPGQRTIDQAGILGAVWTFSTDTGRRR